MATVHHHPHAINTCRICDYRRREGSGPTSYAHPALLDPTAMRPDPDPPDRRLHRGPNHQENIGGPLCRVAECNLCDVKRRVRAKNAVKEKEKEHAARQLQKAAAMKAEAHRRIAEAARAAGYSALYEPPDYNEEPMATVQYGPSLCPPPGTPKTSMADLAKMAELIREKKEKNMAFDQDTVNYELDKRLATRETDRQLTAYDALGEDTYAVDSVIKISFNKDGEPFVFAAIKRAAKGRESSKTFWHLTDGSHLTWDQLKRMLVKLDPVPTPVLLSGPSEGQVPADRPLITDK